MKIKDKGSMITAAKRISQSYGCAVLLKSGHSINDANDLLYADGQQTWFFGKRIDNPNTHGTGCTLSSAIASNLAKGYDLVTSIQRAKKYISGALAAMLDLGTGCGPMNHAFDLHGEYSTLATEGCISDTNGRTIAYKKCRGKLNERAVAKCFGSITSVENFFE